MVIRKASLQVLKELTQHSDCVGMVVSTFLRCGLENDDWRVRQESVQSLCGLLRTATPDNLDALPIIGALLDRLRDPSTVVVQAAEEAIFALSNLMGEEEVQEAVKSLGMSRQQLFAEHKETIMQSLMNFTITPASDTLLQYGFIPINLLNQLRDAKNWKVRAAGIEELQRVVSSLSNVAPAVPHLPSFMELCAVLLADQNFKISLTTLQILNLVVGKFGASLEAALPNILSPLVAKLGDNKIVVKQAIMRFMKSVITDVNPGPVVTEVLAHVGDKNHRVREEALNIVTVALALAAKERQFDYNSILLLVCRALYDTKAKIRDAATDTLAVMCNRVGKVQMNAMLAPVSDVDQDMRRKLQDRFALNALPKISAEGLVLHVSKGGKSGLAVDVSGVDDSAVSRRTTPALTPSTKIPWDLPGSRNGLRQASASTGRRPPSDQSGSSQKNPEWAEGLSWNNGAELDRRANPLHQEGQDALQPDWRFGSNARESVVAPQSSGSEWDNVHVQNGTDQMGYFDSNADYRVIRPAEDPNAMEWWRRGDAPPVGDLSEPPSPTRYSDEQHYLSSPASSASRSFHYDGPCSPQSLHSPLSGGYNSASSYGVQHSPRSFRRESATVSETTLQPTALNAQPTPDSPRLLDAEQDKVKLWLPDAGNASSMQNTNERMPTGAAYASDADPLESWWDKAEKKMGAPITPHRAGRRGAASESSPANRIDSPPLSICSDADRRNTASSSVSAASSRGVGSAPVSAPSSAASSRSDEAKLSILKQNSGSRRRNAGRHNSASKGDEQSVGFSHDVRVGRAGLKPRGKGDEQSVELSHDVRVGRVGRRANPPSAEVGDHKSKSAIEIGSRPMEIVETEDLQPLSAPAKELRVCSQQLRSDEWSVQYQGLDSARRLAAHHPHVISSALVGIVAQVLHLVANLRSSVCRNALLALHDMFLFTKKEMDPMLETVVPVLIRRAGETNAFICEASDSALSCMVSNVGSRAALVTLLRSAADSKQLLQRAKAALHLRCLVESAGQRLLQYREADQLLSVFTTFASDSSPDARREGKRGLCGYADLFDDIADFERKCQSILPDSGIRKALEVVAQGKTQGVDKAFGSSNHTGRWKGTSPATKRGQLARTNNAAVGDSGMFRVDGEGLGK